MASDQDRKKTLFVELDEDEWERMLILKARSRSDTWRDMMFKLEKLFIEEYERGKRRALVNRIGGARPSSETGGEN